MTRVMIVCSAIVLATLLNGCTGVTSARTSGAAINTTSASPSAGSPAIAPAPGTTWYIRNDGGSRYDATNNPSGQCNGKADAAYPGSGANRACAYNDVRYLWSNGSAAGSWAISGGDTVIIRGGPWRIGPIDSSGHAFNGYNGVGGGGPYKDFNLPIPAGTSGQHTRILGENYANCTTKTQLHGGFAVDEVLNLTGAQFVDVQCLELTDYAQCTHAISGADLPCSSSAPLDDYAGSGINTDANTHDVLLQDLDIHGLSGNGLFGPIGGLITITRVRVAFNTFAGWNFDDGNDTDNAVGSTINASYVTMEWNGCMEEYPIVDAIPALYCYDTNSGGFGDSWSGQDAQLSMTCDHCISRYNTKDGYIGPHVRFSSNTITNSYFYDNMGQQLKFGTTNNGVTKIQNTLILGNCHRMGRAIAGAPATFNLHLTGFCRASDTFQMIWPTSGSVELDNDVFVAASVNSTSSFSCTETETTAAISTAGSGYQVNDVLTMVHTFVYGLQVTVTSVGGGGAITGIALTNGGQALFPVAAFGPFHSTRVFGGHGTGASLTVPTSAGSGNTCGGSGAARVMRNVIWLGYTDTDNAGYNGSTIGLFCYTACNNSAGTTTSAQWTNRTNNIFFGFKAGTDACSFAGEFCTDPLLVNEPSQTWISETQLDNFNPNLSSGSPAIGAGIQIQGLIRDYAGNPWRNPPSIGAFEYVP